jgi:hypothetical protein
MILITLINERRNFWVEGPKKIPDKEETFFVDKKFKEIFLDVSNYDGILPLAGSTRTQVLKSSSKAGYRRII